MESAHLLPAFSPETLGSQVLQRFSIYEPGGPDEARAGAELGRAVRAEGCFAWGEGERERELFL